MRSSADARKPRFVFPARESKSLFKISARASFPADEDSDRMTVVVLNFILGKDWHTKADVKIWEADTNRNKLTRQDEIIVFIQRRFYSSKETRDNEKETKDEKEKIFAAGQKGEGRGPLNEKT